ncbi:MAG TPA: lipopolysaccharide heptosyltransferase II [Chloroflexota bacterium]|nr:lipopolysaccharide heptosyltransferase II [Chloroflexota bacterium]
MRISGLKGGLATSIGPRLASLFRRPVPVDFRPRRILVLKPCCLGDVLMSTAAVRALSESFSEAEIDYAVGPWSRPALGNNRRLTELIDTGVVGAGSFPPLAYFRLCRDVRRRRYDLCVILERAALMALLPWFAGIPVRVGLDSGGRGFALTAGVPVEGVRHEVDRYLDVVSAARASVVDPRLEFSPTTEESEAARTILETLGWCGRPFVVLNAGGGVNPGMRLDAKRWPPDRFGVLAKLLLDAGLDVVLTGGDTDRAAVAEVRKHANGVIDLAGRVSFGELAGVFQLADLFVGNDTGAMHLAVAVGTPVVAVFGPTDPRVYGPYRTGEVVTMDVPCRPCFERGTYRVCDHISCTRRLDVELVWAGVQTQLGRSSRRSTT